MPVALVLFRDDDLISPVFDESFFVFFGELMMICRLLRVVNVRVMINEADALA